MKSKAQIGLEYYSWVIILLMAISSIVFYLATPGPQDIKFTSSAARFVVISSNVNPNTLDFELQIQNTGEKPIKITRIDGQNFSIAEPKDCITAKCNPLIELKGRQILTIKGKILPNYSYSGAITITYNAEFPNQTAKLTAVGKKPGPPQSCDTNAYCQQNACFYATCQGNPKVCGQEPIADNSLHSGVCDESNATGNCLVAPCKCNGAGLCIAKTCPDGICSPGESCSLDSNACLHQVCKTAQCGGASGGCQYSGINNGSIDIGYCWENNGCGGPNCKCDGSGNCIQFGQNS